MLQWFSNLLGKALIVSDTNPLPVTLAAGSAGVTSITGTANQVTASAATGAVTLSLPTALTSINSITAAAATDLTLAGGTAGSSAVKVSNTTVASGANTGAFQCLGGAYVEKKLYVGNDIVGLNSDISGARFTASNSNTYFEQGATSLNFETGGAFGWRWRNSNTDRLAISSAGNMTISGDVLMDAGKALAVASGANQRAGDLTLDTGGTVTVNNTTVTAVTKVILTRKTSGGTIGFAVTVTLVVATSFTVTSDNVLDRSLYSFLLVENP